MNGSSISLSISRFQDFKISRFQDFKISRFQNFKISRFQVFKISRFQDCKISRFQDCKISRFQDCKISRFQDCKISRLCCLGAEEERWSGVEEAGVGLRLCTDADANFYLKAKPLQQVEDHISGLRHPRKNSFT